MSRVFAWEISLDLSKVISIAYGMDKEILFIISSRSEPYILSFNEVQEAAEAYKFFNKAFIELNKPAIASYFYGGL